MLNDLGKLELAIRLTDPDAPSDSFLPNEIQLPYETRIDIQKTTRHRPQQPRATQHSNHVHAVAADGTMLQVTLKKAPPPREAQAVTSDGQIIQLKMVGHAPKLTDCQVQTHSAVKHIDDTWHRVALAFNKLEQRLKLNGNDYPNDERDLDNAAYPGKERDLSKEDVETLQNKVMINIQTLATLMNERTGNAATMTEKCRLFVITDFLQWYGARKYKVTKSKAQLGPDLFAMQLLCVLLQQPGDKFQPKLHSPHGKSAVDLNREHTTRYDNNAVHLTSHVRRARKHVLRQAHIRVPVIGENASIDFPFMVDDHHIKRALKRLKKVIEQLNFPDGSRMAKDADALALVGAAGEYVHHHVGGDATTQHKSKLDTNGVVRVRVPEGSHPGAQIKAVAPDGTEVLTMVPEGAEPGQLLTCHYPTNTVGSGISISAVAEIENNKLMV